MKIGIFVTAAIAASSLVGLAKMKRDDDKYAEMFDPQNPPRKLLRQKIRETLSKKKR